MLLILALILVAGMGVFLFRLVRDGRQWVSFPANQAVYSDGVLTVGTLTDRNGTVLAGVSDGQRTYAAYESVRRGRVRQYRNGRADGVCLPADRV